MGDLTAGSAPTILFFVIPAKAGIQTTFVPREESDWIPLIGHAAPPAPLRSAGHCEPVNFAGMTKGGAS